MFNLCSIGFHDWEPEEEFSTKKFKKTYPHGTIEKWVKFVTKQICHKCGEVRFNTKEVHVGYGEWKKGEKISDH